MGLMLGIRSASTELYSVLKATEDEDEILELAFPEELYDDDDNASNEFSDLDKSWHAIHFLLTQTAGDAPLPQGFLLAGEELTGDVEAGPLRWLTPSETQAVAGYLESLEVDFVSSTIDEKKLAEADIYPGNWFQSDSNLIEYVSEHFEELRQFTRDAANQRNGLLLLLT